MIPLPTGVTAYALVAAGVITVGALGFAAIQTARLDTSKAQHATYVAQAEAESAKLRAKSAEVRIEVVTEYRDRVKEIRIPTPVEVVREIEVIRNSGCVLPPEFRLLHDSTTGKSFEPPTGADGEAAPVDCASAIETIRENYRRSLENAAQLEALQKWAAEVSGS